jgi:hypothetical protein
LAGERARRLTLEARSARLVATTHAVPVPQSGLDGGTLTICVDGIARFDYETALRLARRVGTDLQLAMRARAIIGF